MPPPPPPAPPPPPNLISAKMPPKASGNRSALLGEIQKGKGLKKTVTNDRSAPLVGKVVGQESSGGSSGGDQAPPSKPPVSSGLGGLFPNGVPKKPSEMRNMAKSAAFPVKAEAPKMPPSLPKTVQPQSTVTSDAPKLFKETAIELNTRSPHASSAPPLFQPKPSLLYLQCLQHASAFNKPTSQQPQFQTMRPQRNQPAAFSARRSESTEDLPISKPVNAAPLRRPAAPPPPPPLPSNHPRPPPLNTRAFTTDGSMNGSGRNSNASPPPPAPPPRNTSYVESMEQRFQFIPISELPPVPRFVGFRKEYAT
uniref:WH2 domain-containing protein n=1 Tax=Ditylenchus dipsaci TaxID=166011 RepID=A0A915DTW5_9BILA